MKKNNYKLQTKKGQIVYDIHVNIRSDDSKNRSTTTDQDGIFITELKIVHQTQYKTVLSDEFVTVLDRQRDERKKESYYHYIEDISVSIITKESYWPNGIFAHMFTLKNPQTQIKQIQREIIRKINSEYGFLRFCDIEKTIEGFEVTYTNKK